MVVPHNAHLQAIWMLRLKSGKTMSPRYFLMDKVCDSGWWYAEYLTKIMQQKKCTDLFHSQPPNWLLSGIHCHYTTSVMCTPSVTLPHLDTKIAQSWDPPHWVLVFEWPVTESTRNASRGSSWVEVHVLFSVEVQRDQQVGSSKMIINISHLQYVENGGGIVNSWRFLWFETQDI